MPENDLTEPKAIIEQLRKGKMLDHPGLALHIRRTLATNDASSLLKFLKSHPFVQAMAERNTRSDEYETSISSFRPFPSIADANEYLSGPLKFGYINDSRSIFGISWNTLCLPILIMGRVGSGKSVLIKYLLYQIFRLLLSFNTLIFDLKKEYRHLYADDANVKCLPSDRIFINPLQSPEWCHPRDHILAFARTFTSENYLVGTSTNLIIELVDWLYRSRGIYDGSINWPTLKDLYDLTTARLKQPTSKSYRFTDVLLWLQNRIYPYILSSCFNCQFGIPFETFQKENLILEMDRNFTDRMYAFTCASICNQLFMYNKLKDIEGETRHLIVADEARVLFSAHRDVSTFGESILTDIFTKSRAYGISFLLASHESASFNSTMRAIAYLKIAFPINDMADLDFIKKSWGLSDDQTLDLFKLPPYGVAVVRYGGYEKPFLMEVPDFQIEHKLTDDELKEKMSSFYAELDRHIKKPSAPTSVEIKTDTTTNIPPAASALLFYLGKFPFTKVSDLVQAPGFKSPSEVNKALDWLLQSDFVQIEKIRTSKTKMSMYPVLEDKAFRYLGINGILGKGSYRHCLFQHIVCQKLINDGLEAKIEGRTKNSSPKFIDVLAYSKEKKLTTAYEITLSFVNLQKNIIDNFAAGVSECVIVCQSLEDLQKSENIISNAGFPDNILSRTRCVIIDVFFH